MLFQKVAREQKHPPAPALHGGTYVVSSARRRGGDRATKVAVFWAEKCVGIHSLQELDE